MRVSYCILNRITTLLVLICLMAGNKAFATGSFTQIHRHLSKKEVSKPQNDTSVNTFNSDDDRWSQYANDEDLDDSSKESHFAITTHNIIHIISGQFVIAIYNTTHTVKTIYTATVPRYILFHSIIIPPAC